VRQALLGVDGVVDAKVWYDDKRAEVRYAPMVVDTVAMLLAIEAAGFAASVINADDVE
jgi:copper chaperone CopZ